MARIPVYDMPQVKEAPLQLPQQHLDTTGANGEAIGQGLQNLSQGVEQLDSGLREEKQKADTYNVSKALTAFQDKQNFLYHAKEAPDGGYMNLQGEAALAKGPAVMAALQGAQTDVADKLLTNDEQKKMFAYHMSQQMVDAHKQVEVHSAQQWQVAQEANKRAAQETASTAIINSYTDPASVAAASIPVEQSIRAMAKSDKDADAQIQEWQAHVTGMRLQKYIDDGDYQGADALFTQKKDTMGAAGEHYANVIHTLRDQVFGQTTARKIVQDATNPISGLVDESKIQEQFDKLPPGRQAHATDEALNSERAKADRSNKALVNNKFFEAFTVLDKTNSLSGVAADTRTWLQNYAPDKWHELTDKADAISKRSLRSETQANSTEESIAYSEALKDLNEHRYDWKGEDAAALASKYASRLSPKDFKALAVRHAELKTPSSDDKLPAPEAASVQRVIEDNFDGIKGQRVSKWPADAQETLSKVRDQVTLWRQSEIQKNKGVPPSQQAMDDYATSLVVKHVSAAPGFFGAIGLNKVTTRAIDTAPPTDFVRDVTAKFQSINHRDPTPTELQTLYAKHGKKP